jgi:hypothetical protein
MSYKNSINLTILSLILFSFIFSLFSFTASAQITCNSNTLKPVKYGQKGKDVKNLQACLIEAGYNISTGVNAYYGIQTKNTVKKFYSEWYKGKWTGNSIDAKGISKLKEKLLSKKLKPSIASEGKIRKFNIDYDKIESISLSPNGQYAAVTYEKNKKYYVQVGNKIYGPYEIYGPYGNVLLSVEFSKDGSKYGLTFYKDKDEKRKAYVQIDDKTYGPYDEAVYLTFSNDGSKYGWWFIKDDKYYIQN